MHAPWVFFMHPNADRRTPSHTLPNRFMSVLVAPDPSPTPHHAGAAYSMVPGMTADATNIWTLGVSPPANTQICAESSRFCLPGSHHLVHHPFVLQVALECNPNVLPPKHFLDPLAFVDEIPVYVALALIPHLLVPKVRPVPFHAR